MKTMAIDLTIPDPEKVTLEDVMACLREYASESDLDLLKKAYVFATRAHQGQKRKSGEPFMTHPLCAALILAEMRLDIATIVTGLLHDTVEDTLVTLDEIKDIFGEQVTKLVDGVTKLSKIKFSSREARQAENFRKMFMAMAHDIRVILVKLADRLHNIQTLDSLPEQKQHRIATETLEVYAPIAGRLGMQEMKIELEQRSFHKLKPEIWSKIDEQASRLKKTSEKFIAEVQDNVSKELSSHGIDADVQGRVKHHYSIFRKMEVQNLEFEQVYDIIGFRVIVQDLSGCYTALGLIHSLWRPVPGRFKDYIGMPKLNNYQSLHTTVMGPHGHRVEFQIRTQDMHEVAEWGIAAHWRYKVKGGMAEKDEMKFRWLRQFMEWQRDVSDPAEYLDIVKLDLFATDVYIFTPKGDIREFPRGSTPIDFAYSIHTDVGHNCVGARVNGRIVPLRYMMKSGDTVDIITRSDHKPSKDWLKFAKTSRARSKIRQFIRLGERDQALTIGKEILEKEISKFDAVTTRELKKAKFDKFMESRGIASEEELMAQLGYGKVTPRQVVSSLLPPEQLEESKTGKTKETAISRIFRKAVKRSKGIVRVQGFDDILLTLGKCCSPIPGDSITGFVTRGRGVTVHRVDCSRALTLDPERRIDVSWGESAENRSSAKIRVLCIDRPGLLAQISKEISSHDVNISNANCRSIGDQKAINTFEIGVKSVQDLNRLMQSLEKVKGIISVDRVIH
jgi:GTP pyrophosphokinase